MRSTSLTRLLAVLGAGALLAAGVSPSAGAPSGKHRAGSSGTRSRRLRPEQPSRDWPSTVGVAVRRRGRHRRRRSLLRGSRRAVRASASPAASRRSARHGQARVVTGLRSIASEGTGEFGDRAVRRRLRRQRRCYVTEGLGLTRRSAEHRPGAGGHGPAPRCHKQHQGHGVKVGPSPTWRTSRTRQRPRPATGERQPELGAGVPGRAYRLRRRRQRPVAVKRNGRIKVIATFPNVAYGPGGATRSRWTVPPPCRGTGRRLVRRAADGLPVHRWAPPRSTGSASSGHVAVFADRLHQHHRHRVRQVRPALRPGDLQERPALRRPDRRADPGDPTAPRPRSCPTG